MTEQIPSELSQQLQAIRALATIHNLLDKASFSHNYHQAVTESMNFIRSLHQQALSEALNHPNADSVPELVAYKAQGSQEDTAKPNT